MTLRNLMTSLLALTLMVFVGACDSELDETSNLAAFDLSPYCGEGTELNEAETLCVPSAAACGEGTELNDAGTQCVSVYDCFRGGFCATAAKADYLMPDGVNIYAEHVFGDAPCGDTNKTAWEDGKNYLGFVAATGHSKVPPVMSHLCR